MIAMPQKTWETHHVFPNQESCSHALMHLPPLSPPQSVCILTGDLGASCLPHRMTPRSLTPAQTSRSPRLLAEHPHAESPQTSNFLLSKAKITVSPSQIWSFSCVPAQTSSFLSSQWRIFGCHWLMLCSLIFLFLWAFSQFFQGHPSWIISNGLGPFHLILQTCILTPRSVNTLHCHCLLAYLSSFRPQAPFGKTSGPFMFL